MVRQYAVIYALQFCIFLSVSIAVQGKKQNKTKTKTERAIASGYKCLKVPQCSHFQISALVSGLTY